MRSIAEVLPGWLRSLNARALTDIIVDPLQRARVLFLQTSPAETAQIELVEPDGEDSPVQRFLARGGGLNHLCYEVDDLNGALDEMRRRRCVVVSKPKPAVAFNGRPVAWVMTPEWLLIELLLAEAAQA